MLHLGDITKIDGHNIPIVDVVTGGSPCQDLSVAGLRAGLDGERSSLFLEQCRVVREMRERDVSDRLQSGRADEPIRPRYMVWENVQGAFTSNNGRDFQKVLTEIVHIADPTAPDVPMPDRGGWPQAGCIYSEMGEWVDSKGKRHKPSDSPRYKALGNSIAIPFWDWLMKRISDQYDRPATLGSLFDGISGFPYCWSKHNGKENCIWSSEIDEFCITVARKHFGDEKEGE